MKPFEGRGSNNAGHPEGFFLNTPAPPAAADYFRPSPTMCGATMADYGTRMGGYCRCLEAFFPLPLPPPLCVCVRQSLFWGMGWLCSVQLPSSLLPLQRYQHLNVCCFVRLGKEKKLRTFCVAACFKSWKSRRGNEETGCGWRAEHFLDLEQPDTKCKRNAHSRSLFPAAGMKGFFIIGLPETKMLLAFLFVSF